MNEIDILSALKVTGFYALFDKTIRKITEKQAIQVAKPMPSMFVKKHPKGLKINWRLI